MIRRLWDAFDFLDACLWLGLAALWFGLSKWDDGLAWTVCGGFLLLLVLIGTVKVCVVEARKARPQ